LVAQPAFWDSAGVVWKRLVLEASSSSEWLWVAQFSRLFCGSS